MSAINRSLRAASSQTLRLQTRTVRAPAFNRFANTPSIRSATLKASSNFSTMSKLQSNAPPAAAVREYDSELTDIASYVHNTPIDSDLAVSDLEDCTLRPFADSYSSTPHD